MKKAGLLILFINVMTAAIYMDPGVNILTFLKENKIWNGVQPLRLHLGCGENKFSGYINIDFPSSDHTFQKKVAAQVFADITKLALEPQTINEVRSHHVFEHFDRQLALALLCSWHYSLKNGGTILIETPDFMASIKVMLSNAYPYVQKQATLRHIFGSHEAFWAMHYDGWYEEKFRKVLGVLGFEVLSVEKGGHRLIPWIKVHARKNKHLSIEQLASTAKKILRHSMVDPVEKPMWEIWCQQFDQHLEKLIY